MKKSEVEVIQLELKKREEIIRGVLLEEGKEWTLLNYVPVDFVVDGFILVQNCHITDSFYEDEDEFIGKVLTAKKSISEITPLLDLNNTSNLFKMLKDEYEAIQFELQDETSVYLGKIYNFNKKIIEIQTINSMGYWAEKKNYKLQEIRFIQLDPDYLTSLLSYNKLFT